MIKEYFTKRGQALQMGCLLHICCQMQVICCRIGIFEDHGGIKIAYKQSSATDIQKNTVSKK